MKRDWREMAEHLGHIMADPKVVSHCPFCGSGDIMAGGDGTITCSFCNRSFLVMEQPTYNSMPADPNAVPPAGGLPGGEDPALADPNDPAAAADPNAAPTAPKATPTPTGQHPINPQTDPDELAKAPPFSMSGMRTFKTAKGHTLTEDEFVAHLAFTHARDALTGR